MHIQLGFLNSISSPLISFPSQTRIQTPIQHANTDIKPAYTKTKELHAFLLPKRLPWRSIPETQYDNTKCAYATFMIFVITPSDAMMVCFPSNAV
jgi:hypothetical protein